MKVLRMLVVAIVMALVYGTVAKTAPAPSVAHVIHSVSGFGDVTEYWRGSYLFSAVKRSDGTASGQVQVHRHGTGRRDHVRQGDPHDGRG